jgi:hypothetical protein
LHTPKRWQKIAPRRDAMAKFDLIVRGGRVLEERVPEVA